MCRANQPGELESRFMQSWWWGCWAPFWCTFFSPLDELSCLNIRNFDLCKVGLSRASFHSLALVLSLCMGDGHMCMLFKVSKQSCLSILKVWWIFTHWIFLIPTLATMDSVFLLVNLVHGLQFSSQALSQGLFTVTLSQIIVQCSISLGRFSFAHGVVLLCSHSFFLHVSSYMCFWLGFEHLNFRFGEVGEPEPFLHNRGDGQWASHDCNHHIPHITQSWLSADNWCWPCLSDKYVVLSLLSVDTIDTCSGSKV